MKKWILLTILAMSTMTMANDSYKNGIPGDPQGSRGTTFWTADSFTPKRDNNGKQIAINPLELDEMVLDTSTGIFYADPLNHESDDFSKATNQIDFVTDAELKAAIAGADNTGGLASKESVASNTSRITTLESKTGTTATYNDDQTSVAIEDSKGNRTDVVSYKFGKENREIINEHQKRLNADDKKIQENKEFSATNREGLIETWDKATENERKINGHSSAIVNNAEAIGDANSRMDVHAGAINENSDKLSRVNQKVIGNTAGIAVNYDDIRVNEKGIEINTSRINDNEETARQNAENLKTESTIRNNEDIALNGRVDKETSDRITDVNKARTEAQTGDNEVRDEFKAADTKVLATANEYTDVEVTKETKARTEADSKLKAGIDSNTNLIASEAQRASASEAKERSERIESDNQLDKRITSNSAGITSNRQRIDRVEEKANENGAMALATAHALSINNLDAGESALGAGIGVCENAQAISIAVKHQVTEDLGVSASVAGSQSGTNEMRTMYGAGMSLRF